MARLAMKKTIGVKYFAICAMVTLMTSYLDDCNADTLGALKAAREKYIEDFRIHGHQDLEKAKGVENSLRLLEQNTEGKALAQTLFELATIQRLTSQFEVAIGTYERASGVAKQVGDKGIEFDAWLGVARSHAYGTRNHGAADAAFEHAVTCAGDKPTQKQRYEMADYFAQLQTGWGELESALLNALEAISLAQSDSDRFYAFLDTGDVLQKFAESCDYRKLVDAKTHSEDDPWGACKRVIGSARLYYEKAAVTAKKLGWTYLEKQSQGFMSQLDMRLFLLNQKAKFEKLGFTEVFNAQNVQDVLVNEDFSAGGSELKDIPLGPLIDEVAPEAKATDPRGIFLRGVKADLVGNQAQALGYYEKAAALLSIERASMFDIRQSGTVVENRPELIRDLGLRLLKFQRFDEAFVVFESLRSHGLYWLTTAFSKNIFSDAERKWIASLIQIDSLISSRENRLVEAVIAGMEQGRAVELLDELNQLKQQRRDRLKDKQFESVLHRMKSVESTIPTMTQLKQEVEKAKIPVLLYWVTPTNVVVWVVSPQGCTVKTVFLPEVAVVDKVNRFRNSLRSADQPLDDIAAKELHTYLIKPFAEYLTQNQLVIIPQGPLVGLPFEPLIDAEDGKYLAEKLSVSYAPNAAFAMRTLRGEPLATSRITALYDEKIESETHEIQKMSGIRGVSVDSHSSKGMNADSVIDLLGGKKMVHILLHGKFDIDDPLQSTVKIYDREHVKGEYLKAAELLGANWRDTRLAVFSSCEGAVVKTRISNEQFGISWAVLAGGANQVMLSRWRVNAMSNAKWMETFYKSLVVEGMSPSLAANAARREMIKTENRHPYYWAGPQLFGK